MAQRKLILFLTILFLSTSLYTQPVQLPVYHYPFKKYSIKDGLSQSQCMSIFQDSKGFIWVGTKEGINRFDGIEFSNYKTDSLLPKGYIKDIEEDRQGNIWFISTQGTYKYTWDTIYHFLPDTAIEFSLLAIEHDPELNQFWMVANKNISSLVFGLLKPDGKFENLTSHFFGSQEIINNIIYDKVSKRLIAVVQDTTLKSFKFYSIRNKNKKLLTAYNGKHYYLSKDESGQVFITTDDAILKLEKNDQLTVVSKKPCNNCFVFGTNEFAVSNYITLYIKTPSGWINSGLELNMVNKWLVSKNGNFWGATEEGLIKVFNTPFHIYPQDRGMIRYVWDINEGEDGKIWFASYGFGLAYLLENAYTYYPPHDKIGKFLYMGGITTSEGNILFPDQSNVLLYNPQKGLSILKGSEKGKAVLYIYEDTINHQFLLGTNGLKIIRDDKLIKFYQDKDGLDMSAFKYITAIEKDKNEVFWLGSHRGMSKFDGNNFENFYPPKDIKAGVISIHRDYKDNLWFGTREGLLLYDYRSEKPVPVFENEISESVNLITSIDSSFLIAGFSSKLFVLDLKQYYEGQMLFQYFDHDNGFEGGEVGQNGSMVDQSKTVWIASTDQVTRLFPQQLKFETLTPSILLSKLEVFKFGSGEMTHAFNLLNEKDSILEISSKENHLRFYFLSTCEESPSKVEYQYKLLGFDNAWSKRASNRFTSYTNLPIGDFTFLVKACKYGNCSEPKSIQVVIYPANIWERPIVKSLFKLSPFLAILFVVWLFKKVRDQQRKKVVSLEHQLDILKLESINNQVDPHFFFGALASLARLTGKAQKDFIAGISQMLRPVIRGDKNIMRTLAEEIEYVENYVELENIKFQEAIHFQSEISDRVDMDSFIPKNIIQTFINNAVKHGLEKNGGGQVKLTIDQEQDNLLIYVEDNGIGREAARNNSTVGTGNGIRIVTHTLNWLNQKYPFQASMQVTDLKDILNAPLGTTVKIKLYSKYQQH